MSFTDDLNRASVNINRQATRRVRRVALEAFQQINDDSPEDKGTFRANWNVSIDTIDRSVDMEKTKLGVAANVSKATAVISDVQVGNTVFISNSVPYANKLENGYSSQALAGIVAPVVIRIQNAIDQGRL